MTGSTAALWRVIRWPEPLFALTLSGFSERELDLNVGCVPRVLPTGDVIYQWTIPELNYTVEAGPSGLHVVYAANSEHVFELGSPAIDFRSIAENLLMRHYGQNLELQDSSGKIMGFRDGSLRSIATRGVVWNVKRPAPHTWQLETSDPDRSITIIYSPSANVSEIRSAIATWHFDYDAIGRLVAIRGESILAHFDYNPNGLLIGGNAGTPFQLKWKEVRISGGLYGASPVRRIVLSGLNEAQFLFRNNYLGTNAQAIGEMPSIK